MKTTLLKGHIKAIAEQTHPLQTRLSLILTDFAENDNKQGVPLNEKDTLIASAQYMPLKINFDGDGYLGHSGAIAIGPIINVREDSENNKPIVVGDAIIWRELYPEVAEHLINVFENGIGSSWEIYYSDSELDENGVEWLKGCVFAGTCIVETPAYGPNRTRVLAIAENMSKNKSEKQEDKMPDITITDGITVGSVNANTGTVKVSTGSTNYTVGGTSDLVFPTYAEYTRQSELVEDYSQAISELYSELFSKELIDVPTALAEIKEYIASLVNSMNETKSELDKIVQEREAEQAEAAKKEKLNTRRKYLSEAGIDILDDDWAAREVFYSEMSDSTFDTYVEDLKAVKLARSERSRLYIPEPRGQSDVSYTISDIAKAIREKK